MAVHTTTNVKPIIPWYIVVETYQVLFVTEKIRNQYAANASTCSHTKDGGEMEFQVVISKLLQRVCP